VAPGNDFNIGGIGITNSILYGWVCIVFLMVLFTRVAKRVTIKPKGGFIQMVEMGVDFITNLVVNAFDNKKIGRKYAPYFVTIFFFILFNNWLSPTI
jgi:F0F1-type ATP synthase membrane subunit a